MPSVALAIAVSASAKERSRAFFLSSDRSNCAPQYSFFLSSSDCSVFRVATMPSIIATTFSNPIFLPWRASRIRSRRARSGLAGRPSRSATMARRRSEVLPWTCKKLALGLGSVFLNNSSASSSFSTLMVSAKATSSSDLVLTRWSHSSVFVVQLFSRFAANSLSAMSASSVSPRSFFICATETPSSPIFPREDSILAVRTLISFAFEATSSSCVLMADSSVAVASAKALAISSPRSLRIPVIWPLCGAYSEPERPSRKASRAPRSSSPMAIPPAFTSLRSTSTDPVCKKAPAAPFSRAATALPMASMFAPYSALNEANAAASFSRTAWASFVAAFAALRSSCASPSEASAWAFCSSAVLMSGPRPEIVALPVSMLLARSPPLFLQ
mmetsp:Transcript_90922/g.283275  ORF Transcript_90922/g.283275 Transcript_90922/m.283275 type:complete len:386 (-) Transcript_90922:4-1161(-)